MKLLYTVVIASVLVLFFQVVGEIRKRVLIKKIFSDKHIRDLCVNCNQYLRFIKDILLIVAFFIELYGIYFHVLSTNLLLSVFSLLALETIISTRRTK